ncbi:hypothetical protein FE840_019270 (plasmid) [Peteryoungia desertarenae]|uniref:Uncharacterized protein n=1 Tax=Peteryoungia desertarenae TaxID=1813451 RepID=A0ABX6QT51_9HYPH|nr:hypothetical protein [Peteryoungia desertarenae]QLF71764.1 hypothetical protein FE840_019270 [Peteryoungia desertarenae]
MTRSSCNTGPRRRAPVSIRFSESELEALTGLADGLPVSTYIKRVLFGDNRPHTRRRTGADRKLLAQILARLGTYGRGPSLTRLTYLAERGAFYCDEETLGQLRLACEDVTIIRNLLMQALGKETNPDPSDVFNDVAGRVKQ